MTRTGRRVEVLPGPGTAIRFGDLAVWAGPQASSALIGFLYQSARNVAHAADSGRQVVEHLARILALRDPEPGVPFAAIGPDHQSWAVVLHGPVQAWDGRRWLAPTPSPGWLRASVTLEPALTLGPAGSPTPRLALDSPYDLVAGMVPGGGLIVVAGAATPTPIPASTAGGSDPVRPTDATTIASPWSDRSRGSDDRPAGDRTAVAPSSWSDRAGGSASPPARPEAPAPLLPAPGPPAAGSRPPVDLRQATGAGAPLPTSSPPPPPGRPDVAGARCERGHLAPPGVTRCARCGRPTAGDQSGPRPNLGVLIADDGALYRLTSDLLLGADPASDPAVTAGRLEACPLVDPAGALAPAHAEVRLNGWAVELVDRGSAAGTYVTGPGPGDWERLSSFEPRPLQPGAHVALGRRVLTYLSPWTEPTAAEPTAG